MSWSPTVKVCALLIIGLAMASLGLIVYITFPYIINSQINEKLVLKDGGETYNLWKNNPVPMYMKCYFFNVTNPLEFWDDNTSKPIVEEVGPYTFREQREKINITWNDNGTVSYRQISRYFYHDELTEGSLDDIITTLNVPMVAAAAKAKSMNLDFVYFAVSEMFERTNSTWFVQKSVRELLFEGYEDPLITAAKTFIGIPFDKFGWFYGRNGSADQEFTTYTGELDIKTVGEIDEWNGASVMEQWKPPCNRISGSAGDFFPPERAENEEISMFVPDICRTMSFAYSRESVTKGLKSYRYWADNTVFDNGKFNPKNKCYCSDVCLPPGGLNISSCKFDAPAVVSYPHFLFADPSYNEGVIGLHPDPQKHEMFLYIQPRMGIPLEVAARMQINIVFEGCPQIAAFENVTKRTYFPILWFGETAEITDDLVKQLKFVLNDMPHIGNITAYVFVGLGSILVISALIIALYFFHQKQGEKYRCVDSKETS